MTFRDTDVIVIGSGPNGLVAGCELARAGLRVSVLEAHPRRPGGALGTEESTIPGFRHDVGAAFFPFGRISPAFRALKLEELGLRWQHAPIETCHPALDGTCPAITRDLARTATLLGSAEDGEAWIRWMRWHEDIREALLGWLLGPLPGVRSMWKLGFWNLLQLPNILLRTPRSVGRNWFPGAAAQRLIPGLALHADVGPDDPLGAALGFVLLTQAGSAGFPVPAGGAGAIAHALVTRFERHGGRLHLGARVQRIVVDAGRAVGVELSDGRRLDAEKAIVANTSVPALLLDLVGRHHLPDRLVRRAERFRQGFGTFKVDWALSGAVPWTAQLARESAVVHTGEDAEDLARFTRQVRNGQLPERPYLVVGQQSLADPSRAPASQHTLYAYSRVPAAVDGGWGTHAQSFADRVEHRLEGLAPGFRSRILARHIQTPDDLESANANLRGGDHGGGTAAWHNQLIFRPLFPYFRYRMPLRGLYLSSSYAHPGGGVHGMCGYNAAHAVLEDLD